MRIPARAAALAAAAAILACARPEAPTGGIRDVRPPVVIAAEPAPLTTVEDPETVVRFTFSERISERPRQGTLDDAVMVSPRAGAVRVKHDGDALEVSVEGGLRPGLVYRFTLLPVITDLFSNPMRDPFELVLSTGAPLIEDALAGQVLDRVTGRPVPNVEVALLSPTPVPDTIAYVSRTDAAGLYVFRYIPAGGYRLVAFVDRNRNLIPDLASETFGQRVVRLDVRDTLFADVVVFEPDTSRAQLARAEVVDSTTLRLVFSDYLDPEPQNLGQVAVSLEAPEGRPSPGVTRVLHPTAWEAQRDSARGQAGAAPRPAGRVPGAGETVTAPGQERGGLPRGVPLPRQELIVTLGAPLEVDVPYRVAATGVVNIKGLGFGGGQATATRPAPPARSPAPPDAPPGAPRDSLAPAPDSSQVAPPAPPR